MKTKLEMAHEFMLAMIKAGCSDGPVLLDRAWQYADAMQAEADKRENKTRPEVLGVIQQTFINGIEQPRYATSMGDQKRTPKVSRFERSDAVKEVLSRAENMGLIKPKADKEWQPDWSQAPDDAMYWAMDGCGQCNWYKREPDVCGSQWDFVGVIEQTDTGYDYKGDWRESLRKRPQ